MSNSDNDNKGGLTVELDETDIQHLIKRGSSIVSKEIGPIEVKVRCKGRVYPRFVMEDSEGDVINDDLYEHWKHE